MIKKFNTVIPAAKFYDAVSYDYEKMIDFDKNLELRIDAYKKTFGSPGTAADLGCGIGLDSIALAKNGHQVSAFDISQKMIEETKRNAAKHRVNINAFLYSADSIPNSFKSKFDFIVCVGNTIAHFDNLQFKKAIKKMYTMLMPSGKIFLHILNYDLIIKGKKRINNIGNRDGKIIIRFYDVRKKDLDFNILSFPQNSPKEFQLVTTKHYPHTTSEITLCLKEAGFAKIKFMRNFAGDKFNARDSKDIFIEAMKAL